MAPNAKVTVKDWGVLRRDRYPRTHAGVVMAVDDGTIYYVHENMHKGVMIEVMNLLQATVASDASGKRLNSSLAVGRGTSEYRRPISENEWGID